MILWPVSGCPPERPQPKSLDEGPSDHPGQVPCLHGFSRTLPTLPPLRSRSCPGQRHVVSLLSLRDASRASPQESAHSSSHPDPEELQPEYVNGESPQGPGLWPGGKRKQVKKKP